MSGYASAKQPAKSGQVRQISQKRMSELLVRGRARQPLRRRDTVRGRRSQSGTVGVSAGGALKWLRPALLRNQLVSSVDDLVSDAGPVSLLDRQINPEEGQRLEGPGVGERAGVHRVEPH